MKYVIMFFVCASALWTLSGCGHDTGFSFEESPYASDDTVSTADFACSSETSIYVDVSGQVMNPGVYCLSQDARVCDAIFAAGGFTEEAAASRVNQARLLTDGEQIIVPSKEEEGDGLVCINTADIEALTMLPGIGEAKAADIIAYRQEHGFFLKTEDLMNVPGIKEALYRRIKDKIKL